MNVPYQRVEKDRFFHIYTITAHYEEGAVVGARNRREAKEMARGIFGPSRTAMLIKATRGATTNIHGLIERW